MKNNKGMVLTMVLLAVIAFQSRAQFGPYSELLEDSVIASRRVANVLVRQYDNEIDSTLVGIESETFDTLGRLVQREKLYKTTREVASFAYKKRKIHVTYSYRDSSVDQPERTSKKKIHYPGKPRLHFSRQRPSAFKRDLNERIVEYRSESGYVVYWNYDSIGRVNEIRSGYESGPAAGMDIDSMYYNAGSQLIQKRSFSQFVFENGINQPGKESSVWYFYNGIGLPVQRITAVSYLKTQYKTPLVFRYHYQYTFFDK